MERKELLTKWFDSVIGGDSNRAAAEKSGIEHTVLRTRRAGIQTRAEDVIAVARAYGKDPVQSLVETQFLTSDEAHRSNVRSNIADITDLDLASEITRRLLAGTASSTLTDPLEVD